MFMFDRRQMVVAAALIAALEFLTAVVRASGH
jgi:hypothetical protein